MVCAQVPPVYGGAGTQALALAVQLSRRGVDVDIITQNQALAARRERISGVTVRRCPGERVIRRMPPPLARPVRTAWYVAWLGWCLAVRRYDVYHVHGNYWFSLPPALLGRLRRIPVVLKVTRLDDDDAFTVTRRRLSGVPIGWLYGAPTRLASVVIGLNPEVARRHCECFPRVPLARLPNGVDIDRFRVTREAVTKARRDLGIPDAAFVAAFVGYLTDLKGIGELLDAWFEVAARKGADDRAGILLVVGPATGEYRYLSETAAHRALSPDGEAAGIRVLGHLSTADMPAVYAAADVFVLPSRSEGLPNSLLEALASGLPAIASDIPGVSELLRLDPANLILTEPSIRSVRDALLDVLGRAPASAAERVSKLPHAYSLDHVAREYVEIYANLRRSGVRTAFDLRNELGRS